ncbi:MAG: NADPH-dependent F420 reductase [Stenotrophomonas sp.]|nr:NADPH-dependent F420 reductase [Stenotrophomonas sp.]
MRTAIIGTGNIGRAYAHVLHQAGCSVVIGDRDPGRAAAAALELGAEVEGGGIVAAIKLADIIMLALPYPATVETISAVGDVAGKILIDVCNPVSADFQSLLAGSSTSAAEELQGVATGAHVVKAFNTIFAQLVPKASRNGTALQVLIASDSDGAKRETSALARLLGFVAVDAGPLRNSRFIEPIGMMNIQFGIFLGAGLTTAPAWLHA